MQLTISYLYKVPKGPVITCFTEEMNIETALELEADLQKMGRVREIVFQNNNGERFLRKELKAFIEKIQTEPHDVYVYFDGGYEIEYGRAGLGCAIYYEKSGERYRVRKNALVDELTSSNEAEYAALHLAVQELAMLGIRYQPICIKGDSRLVINQMKEEWECYDPVFLTWADRIDARLAESGLEATYLHVPRKENSEADRLATQALDGVQIESQIVIEQP
ncbi:reverse transcriptase-like protein [Salimicrobium salexigens]|uniref:Ribonuclease HI n=1 Tax=Salimicrobium salexigens TaxID=908941 RepID=A0ABY1KXC3_9BACI|nr:reverse transcriptase-like protein [Salimicrobium salexigens]SIS88955.1 ribonuclease HI [Salimicrobium salexigens]